MRFSLPILVLSTALAHSQSPASDVERLTALKQRTYPLLANLPNYTCLETVSRVERSATGHKSSADVIRVAVAVVDRKETYGWPDGGRFLDLQLAQMIGSGMNTTGLYGTLLRGLMVTRNDDFQFAGEGELNGESAFRYDFQILASEGPWNIRVGKESGVAGERGSLWVEAKNLGLRRLEVSALGIPSNVGLKKLHLVVDYEAIAISGRRVLLPAKAWVNTLRQDGKEDLSHVFYNHCRAFEAESTMSADPATGSLTKLPNGSLALPNGLEIVATLETPLDFASASPGDTLNAVVARPAFRKGKEIIAQGARLEGHVRQFRALPDLEQGAVTIEFDRIQTSHGWAQFYARMTGLKGVSGTFDTTPDVGGHDVTDPYIPGLVTIYLPAASAQLPAGTLMTWKTEDVTSGKDRGSPSLETRLPMR